MLLVKDDKVKPFVEWLMQFVDREIPFGDLAKDMRDDHDLPDSNKKEDFEWHLSKSNACYDALTTLSDAFEEYEKYVTSMQQINTNI